jgi:hypothetical protein
METSSFSKRADPPSLSDVFVAGQFDTQKLRWLHCRHVCSKPTNNPSILLPTGGHHGDRRACAVRACHQTA